MKIPLLRLNVMREMQCSPRFVIRDSVLKSRDHFEK